MLRERLRAVHRALNVLARPVRALRGEHGFVLQPYRGYGSSKELFLIGRVFSSRCWVRARVSGCTDAS